MSCEAMVWNFCHSARASAVWSAESFTVKFGMIISASPPRVTWATSAETITSQTVLSFSVKYESSSWESKSSSDTVTATSSQIRNLQFTHLWSPRTPGWRLYACFLWLNAVASVCILHLCRLTRTTSVRSDLRLCSVKPSRILTGLDCTLRATPSRPAVRNNSNTGCLTLWEFDCERK